jgi:hypothetical protein
MSTTHKGNTSGRGVFSAQTRDRSELGRSSATQQVREFAVTEIFTQRTRIKRTDRAHRYSLAQARKRELDELSLQQSDCKSARD